MTEPIEKTAVELKWASYNRRMAALFVERDLHPVDSPGREAAAQKMMDLYAAEGE